MVVWTTLYTMVGMDHPVHHGIYTPTHPGYTSVLPPLPGTLSPPVTVRGDKALGSVLRLITVMRRREVYFSQRCERRAGMLRRVTPALPHQKYERLDSFRVTLL